MKATKNATRRAGKAARQVEQVVRTTVGDLIATLVDTVGVEKARDLFTSRSPLQKVLRQRVVLV